MNNQYITLNITEPQPAQTIILRPLGREEGQNNFRVSIPYQSQNFDDCFYSLNVRSNQFVYLATPNTNDNTTVNENANSSSLVAKKVYQIDMTKGEMTWFLGGTPIRSSGTIYDMEEIEDILDDWFQ